jgi:hypothetical protein
MVDFKQLKENIRRWVSEIFEKASGEQSLSGCEIRERCAQSYPDVHELYFETFCEMFIGALVWRGLNFQFEFHNGQFFFYGIRFRGVSPKAGREQPERRERFAGRSAQDSAPSFGVLHGYIMSAPDSSFSVPRLRKLYEAIASEDGVPFSEFLQDILDKNRSLSIVTKTVERTGKRRKYIDQLALTGRGKQFLAERTL